MSDEYWEPPPDLRRPPLPYCAGFTVPIHQHVPPPPFGMHIYPKSSRPYDLRKGYPNDTQTDWCLRFPPRETDGTPADTSVYSLTVVDQLVCRPEHGAMLVLCRLDEDLTTRVTKIYDALYYPGIDKEWGTIFDSTDIADRDYALEAAAYNCIVEAGMDGCYTLAYHGTWTFDMSVPPVGTEALTTRPVRMMIMDWIHGHDMLHYHDAERVPAVAPERRLAIMAALMEYDCRLNGIGVIHNDFHPRNVRLADEATPNWDVN